MLQNLTGWHALIVLAVIVLIFGAAKLPALARSLGQSVRILKSEVGDSRAETADAADQDVVTRTVRTHVEPTGTERTGEQSTRSQSTHTSPAPVTALTSPTTS